MKKELKYFLLTFFWFSYGFSQTFQYAKSWDASDLLETRCLQVTSSTGAVTVVFLFKGAIDADPGTGTTTLTSSDNSWDIAIVRISANGSFLSATSIGSKYDEGNLFIANNSSDNIFITGTFSDTMDCDPGPGTHFLTTDSYANKNIFVLRLSSSSAFISAWTIHSNIADPAKPASIAADALGNIFLAATFSNILQLHNGLPDGMIESSLASVFVAKYNAVDTFQWVHELAGGATIITDLLPDDLGNIYVAGRFEFGIWLEEEINDPLVETTHYEDADMFILKFSAAGSYIWGYQTHAVTSDGYVLAASICMKNNKLFCAGELHSNTYFTPSSNLVTVIGPDRNSFVVCVDTSGVFNWVKSISGETFATCIISDNSSNVYYVGLYSGTVDFDPGPGVFNLSVVTANSTQMYISKLDGSGNFIYAVSTSAANASYSLSSAIAIDNSNNLTLSGYYSGTVDFDITSGVNDLTVSDTYDLFLLKVNGSTIGIDEYQNDQSFTVYPDPANDYINIYSNGFDLVDMYNITGEIIFSKKIKSTMTLDISELVPGIYYLRASNDLSDVKRKVVIQ